MPYLGSLSWEFVEFAFAGIGLAVDTRYDNLAEDPAVVAGILPPLGSSRLARRALALGAAVLAVQLVTLSRRRAGERGGRTAERLNRMETTRDMQRRMLDVAARRSGSRDDVDPRLRAGQIFANESFASGFEPPFGGHGRSGYGGEKGSEAP